MNRFALREQENLVHTHQTAAAAKQINQSSRPLGPKTPISRNPKTPVRVPVNNENALFRTAKVGLKNAGKGNENTVVRGVGKGITENKQPYTPKST